MENQKKQEVKNEDEQPQEKKAMRQIILETDGNNINIVKTEVAGNLELVAILSSVLNKLQNQQR